MTKNKNGQSLVEILLAFGLAAILLPALLTGFVASREGKVQQVQRAQAQPLLTEAQEAVRSVREKGWDTFVGYQSICTAASPCHPAISGSAWILTNLPTPAETISGLTRSLVISDVSRDSTTGAIVSSGGTVDPSTKKVTVTISWTTPYASSFSSSFYLVRYTNQIYAETTTTDFNAGAPTGVVVVTGTPNPTPTPGDAQVQLARSTGSGGGDWCNPPSYVVKTFDLPGSGVVNAISAKALATQNVAYTTTGGNASGDAVDGLVITQNRPPLIPTPIISNNEAKAYGIYVDSTNTYVYFNENRPPNHTVRIASGATLANVGYYDASGSGSGKSVYVLGTAGYTTVGSKLYKFTASPINNNGASSQGELGSVSLAGTGNKVIVVNTGAVTNAYVATSSTTSQLQIINTSTMAVTKSVNLGNGVGAVDLYVNSTGTYAYVVTSHVAGSGQHSFFIVDLNTYTVSGYDTLNDMSPKGITVVPQDNIAVVVGTGGQLYQVFKLSGGTASWCGGMSPAGVTAINAVDSIIQGQYAFSYILTDNASQEFQIVEGGIPATFSSSGTFTSQPIPIPTLVVDANFNRLTATVASPSATTIKFQVAGAAQVAGSCTGATYTFVDLISPTITGSTLAGIIPTYESPARCFKYKASLTSSDSNQTPVIYDVTVNYSP